MNKVISLVGRAAIAGALIATSLVSLANADQRTPTTEPLLGGSRVDLSNSAVALVATNRSICTGLLVGEREILTAAHCISAPASEYVVVVGGRRLGASEVYFNAAFDQEGEVTLRNVQNDLGMIILDAPVTNIAPIPVIRERAVSAKEPGAVFGYGSNESSGDPQQSVLDWSKFAVVKVEEAGDGVIYTSNSSSDASTCRGDSGGPLMQNLAGTVGVVGVVSSGTNSVDSSGNCRLNDGGLSVYVDLQSPASQRFLANFPGVQYVSGRLITLVSELAKLAPQVDSLATARIGRAFTSRASAASRAFAKLRPLANGAARKELLQTVISSLKQAGKARKLAKARAGIAKASSAVRSLQALGIK